MKTILLKYLLPEGQDPAHLTAAQWASAIAIGAKYVASAFIFFFCVLVAMAMVSENPLTIIFIWVLLGYLATLEGGQVAIVSLASVPRGQYQDTHQVASRCMTAVDKPGNLEKYIMGRQFLVVIVIFVLNFVSSGSSTCADISLGPLTGAAVAVCSTGMPLTFVTIMVSQISSQIVASCSRLDFINNYLMWVNSSLALFIEYSGILHTVHLVTLILARAFGNGTRDENENEAGLGAVNVFSLSTRSAQFFWARVVLSMFLLSFSLAAIFHEVLLGHTNTMGTAPNAVNFIIVFLFMCIIGMYEGLQIALCALAHMDMAVLKEKSAIAAANCHQTFGSNLESFLIGRQMFVTIFVFFVAGTTTISDEWKDRDGYTTFSLGSVQLQALIASGLPASLITTILGSLIFRSAAAKNPVAYLSNPIIGPAIRVCLLVESTGVMQFSWVLAKLFGYFLGFKPDTAYLGHFATSPRRADIESSVMDTSLISGEVDITMGTNSSVVLRRPASDKENEDEFITVMPPNSLSNHDDIEEPDSLYRSIFSTDGAENPSVPLTLDVASGRSAQDNSLTTDSSGPQTPSRDRSSSIKKMYAAAMISGPFSGVGDRSRTNEDDGTARLVLGDSDFSYTLQSTGDDDYNKHGSIDDAY